MISFIHGILSDLEENYVVVEAGGVGYGINVPGSVIARLPAIGTELRMYTHFAVREDGQSLYGFLTKEDREMFRSLLSVNGIGPKGALGILSVLTPDDLRLAIVTGDAKAISRAPGIGAKTAQRLILDLKDKIDANAVLSGGLSMEDMEENGAGGSREAAGSMGAVSEAIDALCVLGYSRMEAGKAVRKLSITADMTTEDILKLALRGIRT